MNDDSERFYRLLYFSAVTAATIGYGDIIPVSKKARLLATGQAILAIVTIGLFLNSLASLRSQGSKT